MLDTVKINHVQHISLTQSRLTDAVSVILSELLSYEHPPKGPGGFLLSGGQLFRAATNRLGGAGYRFSRSSTVNPAAAMSSSSFFLVSKAT